MPENDFEKNVQDKMQGFDLNPSVDLWNKVENRIRKDKNRRFIIWWPLGLFLLGGGIGLAFWLSTDNKKTILPPIAATKTTETNNTLISAETTSEPISTIDKEPTTDLVLINKKPIAVPASTDLPGLKKTNETVFNTQPITTVETTQPAKVAKDEKPIIVSTPVAEDNKTIANPMIQLTVETTPLAKEDTGKKKDKVEKRTQWGLGISGGRSAIVYGLGRVADRNYSSQQSSAPTQLANPRFSGTKGYFSLSAELFMKRMMSPRLDFVGALGYQYLSTRIFTGERVDSSRSINNFYSQNLGVDRFYRQSGVGNSKYYPNQFHFLTISGELSWRVGKKSNTCWNNGVSYSSLVGSSMLHYDQTLRGYYKDNKRLTKNHIFFTTSLSLPLGKRLTLNPFASYSITPVMRNASADSAVTRFSNFGLRFRFLIDRKK